jgi:V-type H+-transporting ATPase subunit a
MKTRNKSEVGYLEEVEEEIESQHKKLLDQLENFDKMREQENYLKEYRKVMVKSENVIENYLQSKKDNEMDSELGGSRQLKLVFGVVNRENMERFKRMIFRASKGSVLIYTFDFEEDVKSADSNKVIFILTF